MSLSPIAVVVMDDVDFDDSSSSSFQTSTEICEVESDVVVVVVVTRLLPRNGGMAENHGAPESGQLLRG